MNKLYRTFLIAMVVLAALGVALLVQGTVRHANRPLTPTTPGGSVRHTPVESEAGRV